MVFVSQVQKNKTKQKNRPTIFRRCLASVVVLLWIEKSSFFSFAQNHGFLISHWTDKLYHCDVVLLRGCSTRWKLLLIEKKLSSFFCFKTRSINLTLKKKWSLCGLCFCQHLFILFLCLFLFMALSTVFHSINSPDNSPLSHSVLAIVFLPRWSFQLYISSWRSPSALT